MLRMTGIVSTNDETEYRCEAYRDDKGNIVLRILTPLYDITSDDVINCLNKSLNKYGATRTILADDDDVWLKIILFTTDPLEADQVIHEPLPAGRREHEGCLCCGLSRRDTERFV